MTASASSKKPRILSKEQQIDLVVKLLLKQPDKERDLRTRINEGRGLIAHGLEFGLEILRESLETLEAKKEKQQQEQLDQPDIPMDGQRSKKRKCGDENENPANNSNSCKMSKGAPDRTQNRSPARPTRSSPLRPKASPKSAKRETHAPHAPATSPAEGDADESESLSIKDLKARLSQHGLQADGCVEKAELQALWEKFETWRQRPLNELQDHCQVLGGPRFNNVLDCARFLTSGERPLPERSRAFSSAAPKVPAAPPVTMPVATPSRIISPPAAGDREQDAQREANRILPLRRESYLNPTTWGFAVLGVPKGTTEVSVVQRAYRALMRKLHPDRAGQSEDVVKAVEKVREAKEACERGLSRQEPPEQPRELRSAALCCSPGQRKFQLSWTAPILRDSAPVRRYVVAAHDPAYGRALTINVLEPDYSQESRSFVSIEHLTSYVMAEEDLKKMPKLWTQNILQVQVAAANDAGQSAWTTLKIPLTGPSAGVASAAPLALHAPRPPSRTTTPSGPSGFASAATMRSRMQEAEDVVAFDTELRKLSGISRLRAFLEPRKKGILQEWLRSVNWSAQGSKQDLVERVIFIREAMVC